LRGRFTPAIGVALVLLVHVTALAWMASGTLSGFGLDDAWIFQVVARNFAATGVLGFLPGQVSSGATSVLWPWLLAANFRWIHADPVAYTLGLGMLCEVAAALAILGVLRADGWSVEWATAAACSLAASGNWLWLAVNGMEAVLFVALGCAAIYAARCGRDWLCAALLTALVLTRLEGFALAGILVVALWWRERRLRLWPFVAAAATLLSVLVWSHATRGTWMPTTMAGRRWLAGAGVAPPSALLQLWVQRLIVLAGHVHVAELIARSALFGVAGAGLWWGCRRTTGLMTLALWTAAQLAAYAIVLPSIGNGGRYQPMVLALIGPWTIAGVRATRRPAVQTAVLASVVVLGLSSLIVWRGVTEAATTHINSVHRRAAAWIAAKVPAEEPIAAYDIGALAWELPGRRVIDLGGLVDPAYLPFMRARAAWQYLDLQHVRWVAVPERAPDTPPQIVAPLALALGLFANDRPGIERWSASTPMAVWSVGWNSVGHAYPQIGVYEIPTGPLAAAPADARLVALSQMPSSVNP